MKKLLIILAAFAVPAVASAKVGFRNMEEEAKHRQICMPLAPVGTGVQGATGVIFSTTVNAVSVPTSTAANAGAPSTFPWPAKLDVIMIDASANGTVACTSAVITGTNQFGKPIKETVSTISETLTKTTNVFATVTSVVGAGCSGGADAGDLLVVRASAVLGLTVNINELNDVESACLTDASASNAVLCARMNNGGTDDLQSNVSVSADTIDTSAAIWGAEGSEVAAAVSDMICLRIRSSRTMSE